MDMCNIDYLYSGINHISRSEQASSWYSYRTIVSNETSSQLSNETIPATMAAVHKHNSP